MIKEADDFLAECDCLAALLERADGSIFQTPTLFKNWTVDDIVGHLYIWNIAAAITLESREKFQEFFKFVMTRMGAGESQIQMQRVWLANQNDAATGPALFDLWRDDYPRTAAAYRDADPALRVAWAGPDMSAPAKIIARQMECWAHAQAIFDVLGETRTDTDRLRNIAELGIRTYSWTFKNRGEDPPQPKPYVELTAPSGALWHWNDPQDDNCVKGDATSFCQIVTQTRNAADTPIKTQGKAAAHWISIAQCFAGAPETPPAKGARHKATI